MVHSEKKENEAFLKESISYLENLGFENIKSDVEGYDSPKSYKKQGSENFKRNKI